MDVVAHGIDLIECERIGAIMKRHGDRFMNRVLTDRERVRASAFASPTQHVAGRFAAKEAVLKMLGTGWRGEISWRDIEVTNNSLGAPEVELRGECARLAEGLGIRRVLLSITHTAQFASASVIGLGGGD